MNTFYFSQTRVRALSFIFSLFILLFLSNVGVVHAQSARLLGTGVIDTGPNVKFPDIDTFCSEVYVAGTSGGDYGNINKALFWSKQDISGDFSSPVEIGDTEGQADYSTAALTVGPNGTVYYAWLRGASENDKSIHFRYKAAGGTWSAPEIAVQNPNFMHYVNIGVTGTQPIVVWRNFTINFSERRANSWTPAQPVSGDLAGAGVPDIATSNNGTIVVVYDTEGNIRAASKQGASSFSISTVAQGNGHHADPTVASGPNGVFYTVWRTVGSPSVSISARATNGTWSTPSAIPPGPAEVNGYPGVDVDLQNGVHVSWSTVNGTLEYAYRAANSQSWVRAPSSPVGVPIGTRLATSFSLQRGIFAHGVTSDFSNGLVNTRYFIYSPR